MKFCFVAGYDYCIIGFYSKYTEVKLLIAYIKQTITVYVEARLAGYLNDKTGNSSDNSL